jgi:adenylyltransferase/sulfurtransferase
MFEFTEDQIKRYSRHILLPEVGGKGQVRISEARVLIVGAGGLGSPAGLYLGAGGVGTIGLIDGDRVDISNLQRQVIHHTSDVGQPKVESARKKIEEINPDVKVITYFEKLTAKNALDLFNEYDIILDGTDTFGSKFLINDAAFFAKKPMIHGGILRFTGQIMTILPGKSACYRCVFKEPPPDGVVPSCQEAGVLGGVAGIIGTLQATEVFKYVLKAGNLLTDQILTHDSLLMKFRKIRVQKNPRCPLCGDHPEITTLQESEQRVCQIQ